MIFAHYCSGPERSQKWSALCQFVESCRALLCLSLTFPFGLFGAWCLNTCLVTFFFYCLRSSHLENPVPSICSQHSVFWEFMQMESIVLAAEGIPHEKMYLHHVLWADSSLMCLSSAAHVLCGAKAGAPYPSFALC